MQACLCGWRAADHPGWGRTVLHASAPSLSPAPYSPCPPPTRAPQAYCAKYARHCDAGKVAELLGAVRGAEQGVRDNPKVRRAAPRCAALRCAARALQAGSPRLGL